MATGLKLINGFVIGKLNYMLPLYSVVSTDNNNKLHKIIMTAARAVIGNYCFKKSISYILNKCKWLNINNMITRSAVMIIHKIIINKSPETIYRLIKTNQNTRTVSDITTASMPRNKRFTNFYIYKYCKFYNSFKRETNANSIQNFKKALMKYIIDNPVNDKMD